MSTTYATDIYQGNGSETEFDLTFQFISRDHINVVIIAGADGAETVLTVIGTGTPVGNEYRWENDTRIKVGTAPSSTQKIRIRRDTPENQQLVPWSDGSYLLSEDLNTSDLQWLYGLQELEDKFGLLQTTAIKYLGAIDLTVDEAPVNPTGGDFFINTGAGTVVASWTGIAGGTVVGAEQVIYSAADSEWQIFDVPSSQQGVLQVTGASPIAVDNTDTQRPDVSITPATASAAGSMSAADKTKLDGVEDGAEANVNSDWNATSGDAEILNKPTIPAAQVNSDWNAASGDAEILNKPAIPADQVNSDWNATTGVAEILNKPVVIPEAPSDGKTYGRKDTQWSEVEPGGVTQIVAGNNVTISPTGGTGVVTVNSTGGGSGSINYSGASAWGDVSLAGTLLNGLNIASTSRTALGTYQITFNTPMPSGNYSVTVGGKTGLVRVISKTANGFDVETYQDVGTLGDVEFYFAVYSINSLPPKGGTATDSWGAVKANGTLDASFNVASVTRISDGTYDVVFTTPMPTNAYAVAGSNNHTASGAYWTFSANNKTTTGFRAYITRSKPVDGTVVSQDSDFSFTVNATNATLPQTVTQEQIDTAINNPGTSAWGTVEADGTLAGGLNVASVTKAGTGIYVVVFTTPMPSASFAVTAAATADSPASNNAAVWISNRSASGFTASAITWDSGGSAADAGMSFAVFSTNALPPKGGTGADAWARCTAAGGFFSSFNFSSITRISLGTYSLSFTTPMPDANYAVIASGDEFHVNVRTTNRTTTSFLVAVADPTATASADSDFSLAVHATNATLPATLTQDMIVLKSGDTMTGELIVPNLSSPSGNLPIQRASVADSQVQSFKIQSNNHLDWYPFNPIPTWCNHVRYNISVVLSTNTIGNGGLYLRWGSASGPLIQPQVSVSGTNASILENGPGTIYYSDPLVLAASPTVVVYYDYVMDFYFYNRGISGGSDFYCYGIGRGAQTGNISIQANVSNARMIVQHIIPQAPNTIQPDRMGLLFFGGTATGGLNSAQVKQTLLTDGPVGFPADLGPTPTPI